MTNDINVRDKVKQVIKIMASSMHLNVWYGADHKLALQTAVQLKSVLKSALAQKEEITIGIVGNELAFEKKPFYKTSMRVKGFIEHLNEIGVEKITFLKGVKDEELAKFIEVLNSKIDPLEKKTVIAQKLDYAGVKHIIVEQITLAQADGEAKDGDLGAAIRNNYTQGVEQFTEAMKDLKEKNIFNAAVIRQLVGNIIMDILKNKELLLILTSTKSHDANVFMHSVNVSIFTVLQAEVLGIETIYLSDIGMAALLHDSGIEEHPKKNTDAAGPWQKDNGEKSIDTAKKLLGNEDVSVLSAITAYDRGILYDKTGYPVKLYDKGPNFVSMMIAIAEYYDRARSNINGKKGMLPEKTYEEMMKLSGTRFHPDLVNNFFSIIGVYPPGTLVELDTGEIGLVIKESVFDIKRPQIELLYDAGGTRLAKGRTINLLEKNKAGKYSRSIVKSVALSAEIEIPDEYK
ncbi:MAG: hypothetical protein ABH869_01830 [Candidatus Omnitrophota bacterium]